MTIQISDIIQPQLTRNLIIIYLPRWVHCDDSFDTTNANDMCSRDEEESAFRLSGTVKLERDGNTEPTEVEWSGASSLTIPISLKSRVSSSRLHIIMYKIL